MRVTKRQPTRATKAHDRTPRHVAVVTGGGSGIGRAVALKFAGQGWNVIVLGRRRAALNETRRLAGKAAARVHPFSCDITRPAAVARMAAAVGRRFQRVDVLVNAAGTNTTRRSLAEFTLTTYREVVGTNLDGAIRCTLAFLPAMRRQRCGTIININSEAGRIASARAGAAYVVSKFGLAGFTQVLNLEERKNGVRACSIFPGDVDTPLVDRRPNPPPPEIRATFLQPSHVADAAWFAASMPPRAVVEELLIRQA